MSKELPIKNIILGKGSAKVALPLTSVDDAALVTDANNTAQASPDIVEWRIDFFKKWQEEQALSSAVKIIRQAMPKTPLIATFRTKDEGGQLAIIPDDYEQLLIHLTTLDIDIIDVEIGKGPALVNKVIKKAHQAGKLIIASSHDFDKTPTAKQLAERFNEMAEAEADILKIATMANDSEDVLRTMSASEQAAKHHNQPVVSMAMGQIGTISRLATTVSKSAITFACLSQEEASAPGQVRINELRQIQNILEGKSNES